MWRFFGFGGFDDGDAGMLHFWRISDNNMKNIKVILLILTSLFANLVFPQGLDLEDIIRTDLKIDKSIPRPVQADGAKVGERHWQHGEIIRYLDSIAKKSSRMIELGTHAMSHGGRNLVSYAISSPENIHQLKKIKAARSDIINPSVKVDLSEHPAVLHMMYSIHGNEPSGANATPLIAYYLNAIQNASLISQLKKVVIILNPVLNPDGLDRFANWSNNRRGLNPSPDSNDREHQELNPTGRTNYYWFDLNRDWLPHQHPESQGRIKLFHEWKPNVQLDFHEQGSDNNFFFMPGEPNRVNPFTPAINQTITKQIASYHAKTFDSHGIRFVSGEDYDDFFVGKGSTYPDLFGCVGILFEQPSSRGAFQDTSNGRLTFSMSIANQFRASLSSLKATAELREELLKYQRDFYVSKSKEKGYFLASAQGDPTKLLEFIRVLRGHEIKVRVLAENQTVNGQDFKANETIAVPLDQEQSVYLKSIWIRQREFTENIFYDVSAWTMPLAFNLTHTKEPVRWAKTKAITKDFLNTKGKLTDSKVGFLIDWRDSLSPRLLYSLLEAGANTFVAKRPFVAKVVGNASRAFGYGTLLVAPELGKSLDKEVLMLLRAAKLEGYPVYSARSSLTELGIDLGSRHFRKLSMPRVAMITGPGTSQYDTGELWYTLDHRISMPLTMIDSNRLISTDLSGYTHLILTRGMGDQNRQLADHVKTFVKNGGILWAQSGSSVNWLARHELFMPVWRESLLTLKQKKIRDLKFQNKFSTEEIENLLPSRGQYSSARDDTALRLVSGVILEGELDISHPLGYGYNTRKLPVFRRGGRFITRTENPYATPLIYTDTPLMSGYMSDENQKLAANSGGILVHNVGKGVIVLVLDIPAFRGFWWGTQKILKNFIFFGDLIKERY